MSKELYIAAHEELIEEYMEEHPSATWSQAYEATADGAWQKAVSKLADAIDHRRMRLKETADE